MSISPHPNKIEIEFYNKQSYYNKTEMEFCTPSPPYPNKSEVELHRTRQPNPNKTEMEFYNKQTYLNKTDMKFCRPTLSPLLVIGLEPLIYL